MAKTKLAVSQHPYAQVALWAVIIAVLWWWPDDSRSKMNADEKYLELAPADIVAARATRLAHDIAVTGTLAPVRQTVLNARVAGEINAIAVREGQSVTAGQVLLSQDSRDLHARLQQAQASLQSAKAELSLSQQNLERMRPLRKQDYVSDNDIVNGEKQVDIRSAQVKSAAASVNQMTQQLADVVIRAPFSGVISERLVDTGQSVAPNTPVLKIVDLSQIEMVAQVAATDVAAIQIGQTVSFTADGFGNQNFTGRITRINPVARAGSRRVDVYVLVDNRDEQLRAGLFAKGVINDNKVITGVAVPFSSLQEREGKILVHVIRDHRLSAQVVTLGRRDEANGLVLVKGVGEGERVLLLPPLPGNEGRMVRMKGVR
jgi:RND family efflux transporter MFP subunit